MAARLARLVYRMMRFGMKYVDQGAEFYEAQHRKQQVIHLKRNYGIEWMRFEPEAPVPELVRTVPHVAFEVDDLSAEIAGKEILIAPNSTSPGVTVAFIVENGAPVEFLQFDKK